MTPERRREIARSYYHRKGAAKRRAWREQNPDLQLEISRDERCKQKERGIPLWNERNPERALQNKRAWIARNPDQKEKKCWAEMIRNYGITKEQYDAMFCAQRGLCAICKLPQGPVKGKPRRLHIDHNHATGTLRSLLCTACNPMLGFAKDNPDILEAAVLYLRQWKHIEA